MTYSTEYNGISVMVSVTEFACHVSFNLEYVEFKGTFGKFLLELQTVAENIAEKHNYPRLAFVGWWDGCPHTFRCMFTEPLEDDGFKAESAWDEF